MPSTMMTRTDCLREYGSDYFVRQKIAAGELYRLGRNIYTENRFVPEFLGLIVNGIVIYHVNWIDIVENEVVFMHKDIQTHPIASLVLENLNSLMIITQDGIKEVL